VTAPPAAPRSASISILETLRRNPDVRRIWLAQVVSESGDWLTRVAVTAHIAGNDARSAFAIAVIQALMVLPFVVLSPWAGSVADRFPRRTVLLGVEILAAIIVLAYMPLLAQAATPWNLTLVGLVVFAHIGLAAFFEASRTALLSSVARPEELAPAMALSQVTWSVCLALGSAAGGFLTIRYGSAAAVVLDSFTFLCAFALLWGVRGGRTAATSAGETTEFREGIRYLLAHPTAGVLVLPKFMLAFVGMSDLTFALLGPREYGVTAETSMSIYFGAIGVGTFLGPPIALKLTRNRPAAMRLAIGIAFLLEAVIFSGTLAANSLWGATAFAGGATACGAIIWSTSMTLLQQATPDRITGRAVALDFALATLAMALALVSAGLLVDFAGFAPRHLLMITTGIYALGGVIWLAILWAFRHRAFQGDAGRPQ